MNVKRGQDRTKLRPQEPLYHALEESDLSFYRREVAQVTLDYRAGVSVPEMAVKLRRKQEEVAVLIMDLALKGKIKPRPGGVFGL